MQQPWHKFSPAEKLHKLLDSCDSTHHATIRKHVCYLNKKSHDHPLFMRYFLRANFTNSIMVTRSPPRLMNPFFGGVTSWQKNTFHGYLDTPPSYPILLVKQTGVWMNPELILLMDKIRKKNTFWMIPFSPLFIGLKNHPRWLGMGFCPSTTTHQKTWWIFQPWSGSHLFFYGSTPSNSTYINAVYVFTTHFMYIRKYAYILKHTHITYLLYM